MAAPADQITQDRRHMEAALRLAKRGLGTTWPNPTVGCIIVRDGQVVGRGWTQPGGRPHAEAEALARAGAAARNATAYVTLEPCAHHGETPPCAERMVGAGIGRVVIALQDPDPRVDGRGLAHLRDAGVEVALGLLAAEAAALNAGFLTRVRLGRPEITLKLATTLDGRIATRSGESRWITGPTARDRAHLMRAEADAVMVGIGTVLGDDPDLTCRVPGLETSRPVRIVIDRALKIPPTCKLVRSAREIQTWVVTVDAAAERAAPLVAAGVEVLAVAERDGHVDLAEAAAALGKRGLTRILVEGGGGLAAGLLARDLVDRIAWFHAPRLLGDDALPALGTLGIAELAAAPRLARTGVEYLAEDVLETFVLDPQA